MNPLRSGFLLGLCALAAVSQSHAESIEIVNAGFETPELGDVTNVTFDGAVGGAGVLEGWNSNEPGIGGAIRFDEQYPGRTGSNVLYLHGTGGQNFHTREYDLGEDLQSNTTYVLSFDVVRRAGVTRGNSVVFRAGLYTGIDYDSRVPLVQHEGELMLVDRNGSPADKVRVTLVVTTKEVEPGTKFWIGGDVFDADEFHRAQFDNFTLDKADKVGE
jgi:hypothetical protein